MISQGLQKPLNQPSEILSTDRDEVFLAITIASWGNIFYVIPGQKISLKTVTHQTGSLTVCEPGDLNLFQIQRVYFLHSLSENSKRGGHAHKQLRQFVIAIAGQFTMELENLNGKVTIVADDPTVGFYIPPLTWRDLYNFSADAVCLVFASDEFDEGDYIRDYVEFSDTIRPK